MRFISLKTTGKVDLIQPIMEYSLENYGKDTKTIIERFVDVLNHLRNDISNIQVKTSGDSVIHLFKSYLGLLCLIEKKFPLSGGKNSIQIKFKWIDSLNPSNQIKLCDVQFEKACIIYNLAAAYCNSAVNIDRANPMNFAENIKLSIKNFSLSAGYLEFLRDEILPKLNLYQNLLNIDLTPSALNMNIQMILAQSQTCVYEKAVKDELNKSLLSKLAYQISLYYKCSLTYAKKIGNDLPPHILAWLETQELLYLAAASYQKYADERPLVEKTGEGYGPLIARLQYAKRNCDKASKILKQFSMDLNIESLEQIVDKDLTELEKDNSLIYLELVPDESSLTELFPVNSVSSTPITYHTILQDVDQSAVEAFDGLLPLSIKNKFNAFTSEIKQLFDSISNEVRSNIKNFVDLRGEINSFLSMRSAHKYTLPGYIWDKILDIQTNGGLKNIESMLNDLDARSDKIGSIFSGLNELMSNEKYSKHSNLSSSNNFYFRDTLSRLKYNSSIYEAKYQDAVVLNNSIRESFNRIKGEQDFFSLTKNEIEDLIPKVTKNAAISDLGESISGDFSEAMLAQQCQLGNDVIKNLEDHFQEFTSVLSNTSGLKSLINQAMRESHSIESVFDKERKKMHANNFKIREYIESLHSISESLQTKFTEYKLSVGFNSLDINNHPYHLFFKDLSNSCDVLLNIVRDTKEGLKFFDSLSTYLNTLAIQIKNHLNSFDHSLSHDSMGFTGRSNDSSDHHWNPYPHTTTTNPDQLPMYNPHNRNALFSPYTIPKSSFPQTVYYYDPPNSLGSDVPNPNGLGQNNFGGHYPSSNTHYPYV